MLKAGERIPAVTVQRLSDAGPVDVSMRVYCAGRKVLLFALPGAFTPTCSGLHLPGYIVHADDFLSRGIEAIACLSTSDYFVMDAWGRQLGVGRRIDMLADGNHEFTRAAGMITDLSAAGLGLRSRRYALIADDCVIVALEVDQNPSKVRRSSAEYMLTLL